MFDVYSPKGIQLKLMTHQDVTNVLCVRCQSAQTSVSKLTQLIGTFSLKYMVSNGVWVDQYCHELILPLQLCFLQDLC